MSSIFWKHFHLCFSSLRCLPSVTPSSPSPSKIEDQNNNPSSSANTSLLIKSFNSLYDQSSDFSTSKSITPSTDDYFSDTDSDAVSPPDFTTIFASQRFFFSSPGRSNSIIESSDITKSETHDQETPLNGGVAVKKYSPDPYQDFRCSMQEMIEARNLTDVMANWDFLHELLLCYLTLNPKHTHKFIISAFADILISLLSSQDSDSRHRRWYIVGGFLLEKTKK